MRRSSRITQAATGTALGCLAALVTACGTASPSAGGGTGTTTGHVSSSPSARPSHSAPSSHPARHSHHRDSDPAAPSGTGSGGSGSAGTAASPACRSGDLGVTASSSQGTAGSVYAAITFTNRGTHTCTLYGYPGVSAGTGTPFRQVGEAAVENPSPPRELVTLPPGGTASSVLQIAEAGNYSSGQCRPERTSELQVYPPNQTQALDVPYSTTGCAGPVHLLTVSVVQPGHAPQA